MKGLTLAIASLLYAAAIPLGGASAARAAAPPSMVLAQSDSSGAAGAQGASSSDASDGQAGGDQFGGDQSSGGAGASYGDPQSGQSDSGQAADQSGAAAVSSPDRSATDPGDILLGLVALLVIATVVLAIVLIPAIIAFSRRHTYKWVIAILCFLGPLWIVAIVWSLWPDEGASPRPPAVAPPSPSRHPAPAPTSLPSSGYSSGPAPNPPFPNSGPAPMKASTLAPLSQSSGFSAAADAKPAESSPDLVSDGPARFAAIPPLVEPQSAPAAARRGTTTAVPIGPAATAEAPPAKAAPPVDLDALERLAALHRSGVLTDAEFAQQKRLLLGQA